MLQNLLSNIQVIVNSPYEHQQQRQFHQHQNTIVNLNTNVEYIN
jgi:hypothetical protein